MAISDSAGPFRFCPYCARPLESVRIPEGEGPERQRCNSCGYIHWGNAKPTASGIVRNEAGQILLSRRGRAPSRGLWDIPGGFLEAWEHPEEGVRRELFEETGLTVEVVRLIGVYIDTYGPPPSEYTLNFNYVCVARAGTMAPNDDVSELGWFNPLELPSPIAFRNAEEALRDYAIQEKLLVS